MASDKGLIEDARKAGEEAIQSYLPGHAGGLLAAGERLFQHTLQELGVLIGPRGAQAVARRAIQQASMQHPCLGLLQPAEEGVPMGGLSSTIEALGCEAAQACLATLYQALVSVAASLIGEELLIALLARVKQAAND